MPEIEKISIPGTNLPKIKLININNVMYKCERSEEEKQNLILATANSLASSSLRPNELQSLIQKALEKTKSETEFPSKVINIINFSGDADKCSEIKKQSEQIIDGLNLDSTIYRADSNQSIVESLTEVREIEEPTKEFFNIPEEVPSQVENNSYANIPSSYETISITTTQPNYYENQPSSTQIYNQVSGPNYQGSKTLAELYNQSSSKTISAPQIPVYIPDSPAYTQTYNYVSPNYNYQIPPPSVINLSYPLSSPPESIPYNQISSSTVFSQPQKPLIRATEPVPSVSSTPIINQTPVSSIPSPTVINIQLEKKEPLTASTTFITESAPPPPEENKKRVEPSLINFKKREVKFEDKPKFILSKVTKYITKKVHQEKKCSCSCGCN